MNLWKNRFQSLSCSKCMTVWCLKNTKPLLDTGIAGEFREQTVNGKLVNNVDLINCPTF